MNKESIENTEKELVESINTGKLSTVKRLLKEGVDVDCIDHTGMSPLQHACYKGDLEMCRSLLSHGANINDTRHHHGYTALMFAALSGNIQVVRFLLEKGADTSVVNSVKRTAAQMASFVGRHKVASIINNFINFEDLAKYSYIKDKDGKALLSQQLLNSLYQYILTSNFHPIHLAFILKQRCDLLWHKSAVCQVLEEMVEGLMKKKETDEVAAMKLHYFSSYLQQAFTHMLLKEKSNDQKLKVEGGDLACEKSFDIILDTAFSNWLKYLMKHNTPSDNPLPNQELITRRALLSFPIKQSQLFQQIVSTVSYRSSKGAVGVAGISAMECLANALNGQRMKHEEEDRQCASCAEFNGKACNTCRSVYYCNRECQKLHWSIHKSMCAKMKEKKELMERLKEKEEEKKEFKEKEEKNKNDTITQKKEGVLEDLVENYEENKNNNFKNEKNDGSDYNKDLNGKK